MDGERVRSIAQIEKQADLPCRGRIGHGMDCIVDHVQQLSLE
jgi:hypothetical protein